MIPRALFDDIRTLNAPEAKKLREQWIDGEHSGAKITIAEAELLHEVAGVEALSRFVAIGVQETKFAEAAMTYRKEQKKKKTRKRKKKAKR